MRLACLIIRNVLGLAASIVFFEFGTLVPLDIAYSDSTKRFGFGSFDHAVLFDLSRSNC